MVPPDYRDTVYWGLLSDKEKAGRKGKDFKAFYKHWLKGHSGPVRDLVYRAKR